MIEWLKEKIFGKKKNRKEIITEFSDKKFDLSKCEKCEKCCELKNDDYFLKMKDAVEKTLEEMKDLSDEEFKAELKKCGYEEHGIPICNPNTCHGECQGMGECYVAVDFRNKIRPKIKNKDERKMEKAIDTNKFRVTGILK